MVASWQKRSNWIRSHPHWNVISVVDRSTRANSATSSMYIVAFGRRPRRSFFSFATIASTCRISAQTHTQSIGHWSLTSRILTMVSLLSPCPTSALYTRCHHFQNVSSELLRFIPAVRRPSFPRRRPHRQEKRAFRKRTVSSESESQRKRSTGS